MKTSETLNKHEPGIISPYTGGTVLEIIGIKTAPIAADSGPDPTAPVPFQTHTTSGEGMARISDDQDQEHLYE